MNLNIYYILDSARNPVPCDDVLVWAKWNTKENSVVANDKLINGDVSTVFLGIDHNYSQSGPPVLWETMVFGGPLDGEQQRYTSEADALAGHAKIVEQVRRGSK